MPFQNNLKKYVGKASYSFEYSSLFYHNSYCKKYESVIQWYTQALCKTKKVDSICNTHTVLRKDDE